MECQFTLMENTQKLSKPLLASFPQHMPEEQFINPESKECIKFTQYAHENPALQDKQKMVLGISDKMVYTAKKLDHKNASRYLIGIRIGNKIRIVEADSGYQFSQHIKAPHILHKEPSNDQEISYFEQKVRLVEDFGTKKSKKKISSLLTNKVEAENIQMIGQMEKILTRKAESVETKEKDEVENENLIELENKKEILPSFDLTAKEPKNIYYFEDLISKEEYDQLPISFLQKVIKNPKKIQEIKYDYEIYTLNLLSVSIREFSVALNPPPEKKEKDSIKRVKRRVRHKLKCIIYLNYLLKMYKLPNTISQTPAEISKAYKIPIQNVRSILNKFTETRIGLNKQIKYMKNKMLNDKLICYILIIMLFINEFQLNSVEVGRSLKMAQDRTQKYFREVGCMHKGTGTMGEDGELETMLFYLKAPLVFPKLVVRKGR